MACSGFLVSIETSTTPHYLCADLPTDTILHIKQELQKRIEIPESQMIFIDKNEKVWQNHELITTNLDLKLMSNVSDLQEYEEKLDTFHVPYHVRNAEFYEKTQKEWLILANGYMGFNKGNFDYGSALEYLKKLGETFLISVYNEPAHGMYSYSQTNILTDQHVYAYDAQNQTYAPVYTFDSPLTMKNAKILTYKNIGVAFLNPVSFEALIRTIPGSYKNGSWRQLNGFFGLYVNDETNEASRKPPV
jgi:hypothetical protein